MGLHRQSAVERKRIASASKSILHVILHIHVIRRRVAVVVAAHAAGVTARSCRVRRIAVRWGHPRAGSDRLGSLRRRNGVAISLRSVILRVLNFVRNGNGGGLVVTLLVRHDEIWSSVKRQCTSRRQRSLCVKVKSSVMKC